MRRAFCLCLLCAASTLPAHAETFVIPADQSGHEVTIKMPAGAVTKMSADRAENLVGYAGSQIEAMRLSGDVLIGVAGSTQAIEIKAESVVLELTADAAPGRERHGRAASASNRARHSNSTAFGGASQLFVGDVVFDLQTASGPMEIKADRVEHRWSSKPGA